MCMGGGREGFEWTFKRRKGWAPMTGLMNYFPISADMAVWSRELFFCKTMGKEITRWKKVNVFGPSSNYVTLLPGSFAQFYRATHYLKGFFFGKSNPDPVFLCPDPIRILFS